MTSIFGDGLESVRGLNGQNQYNVTVIVPSFPVHPYYGDSDLQTYYKVRILYDTVGSLGAGHITQRRGTSRFGSWDTQNPEWAP